MPRGRPRKELPDNWENTLIDLMSEGASITEVRAELGIWGQDTYDRFMEENEDFKRAIKTGELLSKAWWEKHGRSQLSNKEFNSTLWYMNMKNRFGWRDQQQVQHTGDANNPVVVIAAGANPYEKK